MRRIQTSILRKFKFHDHAEVAGLKLKLIVAGIAEELIEDALALFKTHHRLHKVHSKPEVVQGLADNGLVSAHHIAEIPRNQFIKQYAESLGITNEEAEDLHRKASGMRNNSMHLWATIKTTTASPVYRNSRFFNTPSGVSAAFENLPSYAELFGSLNYCECDECSSIFGPAAYLVDLLRIIDRYITHAPGNSIATQYQFVTRRPDIGKIPLTCSEATTMVPNIQIANDVMLNYLTPKGSTTDAVLQQMATTAKYPFTMPFNVPLDRIYALLNNTGANYGSILAAWQQPAETVAMAAFGLSIEQYNIIITAAANVASVESFYNVTDINSLSTPDTFITKTQMEYQDMLTLISQDLSDEEQSAGIAANFFINQGQTAGNWVNIENGTINNLGLDALDQANRIRRLALAMNLSIQDTDWTLRCIAYPGAPQIATGILPQLSQLISLSTALGISLQSATVLLGPI